MLKRKLLITFLTIITVLATFLGVACKPKDSTDDSSSSGAGGGGNRVFRTYGRICPKTQTLI